MKFLKTFALCALLVPAAAFAAGAKSYQVTGKVLEITDAFVAVEKGKERWEINRAADTKLPEGIKVGDKVTIFYTMTAAAVEAKAEKAGTKKR
ncbi:MAG: hypothetical protein HUU04_05930 [Verrucomicrobiae bacterium]|nr:hypothetical protein [Verrucomicrobiae bacterium]